MTELPYGNRLFIKRYLRVTLYFIVFALLTRSGVASAQLGEVKVAILRATVGDPGKLADEVDAALLSNLSELAGIKNPTVSPIEYDEIRLTVGCQDESRSCLASIAKLVRVDAVLVRTLDASVSGTVALSLLYFDATSSEEPARVEIAGQGSEASKTAVEGVAAAIRSLFGIPEAVRALPAEEQKADEPVAAPVTPQPTAATAAPPADRPRREPSVSPFTWAALGAGSVSLAVGLIIGLSASDAYDDYTQTTISTDADIRSAEAKLNKARSRGTLANIFIPTGAVLLVAGGVLLALDLWKGGKKEQRDQKATGFYLQPTVGGAVVMLDGSWKNSW